jgi:hypothetical protein
MLYNNYICLYYKKLKLKNENNNKNYFKNKNKRILSLYFNKLKS